MLLYLHIPFCDSKCSYCAFNSYTNLHGLRVNYMKALAKQLQDDLKHYQITTLSSIFIGGGTPSTVPPALYKELFEILSPYISDTLEITTEANPNSATKEWLQGMFNLGVNRVSFGVQSFDQEKLQFLNRAHTPQNAIDAIHNAQAVGFKNISLDLIYATQLDTKELLENDLTTAFALPINHLSAYALTIEEGTPFEKTPKVASEDESLTTWLFETINKHGFIQYEISNFGSYQSRHNQGYWKHEEYLGVGAGAVGYINQRRLYPHKDVQAYIDDPLFKEEESLGIDDIKMEKVLLGLRSSLGFFLDILNEGEKKRLQILLDENKLFEDEQKLIINKNYLLADELALFILN
ncbi:MAG: radical SAM family heme chaperone HemW [Thiovulaceae bacterium]|nr:radical SAM family heme chaperone HemW [Sulfurimonadaceae bacterium]